MEKQSFTSIRALTLPGFMATLERNVGGDNLLQIKRHVQQGIFEEMWSRVNIHKEISFQKTYPTVGILTADIFSKSPKPTLAFKKELAKNPRFGHIRSKYEFHNDVRFILTVVDDQICLLMDNAAADSKMATVMIYNKTVEAFVEAESLFEFSMSNDIRL